MAAKRYLCAARPEYFKRLSEASVHSLNLQGRSHERSEIAEFEKNPNVKEIVKVRYYDDAGKRADLENPAVFLLRADGSENCRRPLQKGGGVSGDFSFR